MLPIASDRKSWFGLLMVLDRFPFVFPIGIRFLFIYLILDFGVLLYAIKQDQNSSNTTAQQTKYQFYTLWFVDSRLISQK